MADFPHGFAIESKGQQFRPVRVEPHVRKSGEPTRVIVWETECPDCKATFECISPLVFKAPRRRCDACRKPGKPCR